LPLLALAALLAASLATPVEVRTGVVDGRFLQVLVIARGQTPVVLVPRTILGCYIEVDIQDTQGISIGHFGPRAQCTAPGSSDYAVFRPGELFGVQLDILGPETVRLVSAELDNVAQLEKGREYRFVVTYHNDENRSLSAQTKRSLQKQWGAVVAPVVNITANPVSFRRSQ
jgi:hypothetical protein